MKWVKNQDALSSEHYTLLTKDSPALELKFNYHTNTARVAFEGEKRAFMIDNGALLRNKILILNEYGLEFGQLSYENDLSSEGYILIENKEFRYVIDSSAQPKIMLYDESSPAPISSCMLPEQKAVDFSLNKNIKNNAVNAALILLASWYLYLPVLKRNAGMLV